jgi:hypothetical protein
VVDARQRKFVLPKDVNDLNRFTPFKGNIPTGSVVLVGFLTGAYDRDTMLPGITYNLQFVAVLGNGNMAGEYTVIVASIRTTHCHLCSHGLNQCFGWALINQYMSILECWISVISIVFTLYVVSSLSFNPHSSFMI